MEEEDCPAARRNPKTDRFVLAQAKKGNGQGITLLKSLLTSVCENNCLYCFFRSGRDFPRLSYLPDEFAKLSMNLTKAGLIRGVFLSSGVAGGGVHTQDRLLDTAEILRNKLGYKGYLHLKIMPGAEFDQVLQAMRLADRISINLEAPNVYRLPRLAPGKNFEAELLKPLQWADEIRKSMDPIQTWKGRWPSSCTQFVAGGSDENDREQLETSQSLHRNYHLRRVYFCAFRPLPDTPLENHPATTYRRELRLYQADYLIRDYGFSQQELIYNQQGNLVSEHDPKLAWAEAHLRFQPVEINTADRESLLRVPGIGLKGVETILKLRREHPVRDISTLEKWGLNTKRMRNFILTKGHRPIQQPSLF